jgi:hypothetical protein
MRVSAGKGPAAAKAGSPAGDLALKVTTNDAALDRLATEVIQAASKLGETVDALSNSLGEIDLEKAAGEAALKKAVFLFSRATGELSTVWGNLNEAIARKKSSGAPGNALDDLALENAADRLREYACALGNATDRLGQRMGDMTPGGESPDAGRMLPTDDIALK